MAEGRSDRRRRCFAIVHASRGLLGLCPWALWARSVRFVRVLHCRPLEELNTLSCRLCLILSRQARSLATLQCPPKVTLGLGPRPTPSPPTPVSSRAIASRAVQVSISTPWPRGAARVTLSFTLDTGPRPLALPCTCRPAVLLTRDTCLSASGVERTLHSVSLCGPCHHGKSHAPRFDLSP